MFLPMQAVANARRRIYLLAPLNQVKKAHKISGIFERGWGGGGSATSSSGFLIALFCAGDLFPRAFPSHFRRKEVRTRLPRRFCNGWVLRDLHPALVSGHTHEMASFKINNINHHNQRARNDCSKKCTDWRTLYSNEEERRDASNTLF